ncbi:hypothetical protein [Paludisphaera mucosa]|uniref:Uncharacterized protein n=1 Tax=Paludisphaera mucosa TaxID=3030827 RepID=A0ABT6F6N7_9BACT|nr:hypothetical protein [Paludisphaera mucosa]MDG3003246.1 hypothetical protein [Paludisphaera mucosa]
MSTPLYIDEAVSTAADPGRALGGSTIKVAAGDGAKFVHPTLGPPSPTRPLRIQTGPADAPAVGYFLCTGRSGDDLTVAVAAGKTDQPVDVGDQVSAGWVAADADELYATIANAVVGKLAAGGGVTITGAGTAASPYTIAATGGSGGSGTVTSVNLTVPAGLSVTGGPVTGAGTFAIATTLSGVIVGTGSGFAAGAAGTDYVSPAGLASALSPYATTAAVGAVLGSYVTATTLSSTLSGYATTTALTAGLGTKQGTITTGSTSQYLKGDLSLGTFATDVVAAMSSTLSGYVTSSALTTALGSYVTSTSLTTTLGSYALLLTAQTLKDKSVQASSTGDSLKILNQVGTLASAFDADGFGGDDELVFLLAQGVDLTTGTGLYPNGLVADCTGKVTSISVVFRVNGGSGGATVVVTKNGTTIATLTVSTSTTTLVRTTTISDTAIASGDVYNVNVTSVGSAVQYGRLFIKHTRRNR